MKRNTVLITGILAILLIFGAAVAFAQNNSEKTVDTKDHECTPEMMENMTENCPGEMMQSDGCGSMMKDEAGSCEMMGTEDPEEDTGTSGESHCGDMDAGIGSMMGSSGAGMKRMM